MLAHCIEVTIQNGLWKPIQLVKNGTPISFLFFTDDLVLFGEVSTKQVEMNNACLEIFYANLGPRVKPIFFFKNINHNRVKEIGDIFGFSITTDLEKYLGIPLHHKRVSKNSYCFIFDKV